MKMKGFLLTAATAVASLHGWCAYSQARLRPAEVLDSDILSRSVVAAFAVTDKGDTLVDRNSKVMLVPASNMKLITTGAALHKLGKDYKFRTSLGYSGAIENGVLKGDLYIIGGADPTLASADTIATPFAKTFLAWKGLLDKAGIRKIEGHIVGDGRYIDGMLEEQTWQWYDLGTHYGCGVSGLSFFENGLNIRVSAGQAIGEAVTAKVLFPEMPWMKFRWDCTTGKKGSGDQLYLYTSDLAPSAEIRGTYALGMGPKILRCSNKFPEYTCAWYFSRFLRNYGIICTEGPADLFGANPLQESSIVGQKKLTVIGDKESPTLEAIARVTNRASNNFYAETIFRTLGKEMTGSACYDSSRVAIYKVLDELKVGSIDGARITDGSGLSKHNYLSPDFICCFLKAMQKSPAYKAYLEGLPWPGGPGTLKSRLWKTPEKTRLRIHAKSGSMDGVRCYSGYILPEPGKGGSTVYFSLMINNCTARYSQVNEVIDQFLMSLM